MLPEQMMPCLLSDRFRTQPHAPPQERAEPDDGVAAPVVAGDRLGRRLGNPLFGYRARLQGVSAPVGDSPAPAVRVASP